MAKDPAFLFYSSDFLTGTMFMTNEQAGIYIRLLCAQHQHKGIIDKVSFNSMVGDHQIIRNKFTESEEGFYNERLNEEASKRETWVISRKNNKNGYNQHKKRSYDLPSGGHMENENENENIKNIGGMGGKVKHQECVYLTTEEYQKLVDKFGAIGTRDRIEELNTGIMSKGYKYKSHYHTILSWDKRRKEEKPKYTAEPIKPREPPPPFKEPTPEEREEVARMIRETAKGFRNVEA